MYKGSWKNVAKHNWFAENGNFECIKAHGLAQISNRLEEISDQRRVIRNLTNKQKNNWREKISLIFLQENGIISSQTKAKTNVAG